MIGLTEKLLEKEYNIPMENNIRKEVEGMCNLSQVIKEKAYKAGEKSPQYGIIFIYSNSIK